MKNKFDNNIKLRLIFTKLENINYKIDYFKVQSEWNHDNNTGFVKLKYRNNGLTVLFIGVYKDGKKEINIMSKFSGDVEYQEIQKSTFLNTSIPSFILLKKILSLYSIKQMIFASL